MAEQTLKVRIPDPCIWHDRSYKEWVLSFYVDTHLVSASYIFRSKKKNDVKAKFFRFLSKDDFYLNVIEMIKDGKLILKEVSYESL